VQALERHATSVAAGLGYDRGGDARLLSPGTVTLFSALDILTGGVILQCQPRIATRNSWAFLNISRPTPNWALHLIADNYATHKHPRRVKAWLARHPLSPALHAHLLELAQPDRALVRAHHPAGYSSRLVPQRPRTGGLKSTAI
jgi:hypothetical protein